MIWNASPQIFTIGNFEIRWYGLLFASSFLFGYRILRKMFILEKKPEADLEQLFVAMFLGTTLGARLGHCFFYEPEYFLTHPLEILMIWKGGLASHGAAVGILIALYFFSKKKNYATWLWTVDRIVVAVALGGSLIRLGNFMNSEIIGKKTDLPWAVVFAHIDSFPRHPTQLYESFLYFLIFILLFSIYKKKQGHLSDGFLTGLFFVLVFTTRFFVEFLKENQVAFEEKMALNMGQILSIPSILFGLFLIIRSYQKNTQKNSKK